MIEALYWIMAIGYGTALVVILAAMAFGVWTFCKVLRETPRTLTKVDNSNTLA